jgi:hypothetical protein
VLLGWIILTGTEFRVEVFQVVLVFVYSYSRDLFVRLNKTPWRDRLLRLQIGNLILPNSVQDYGKALITIVVTSASEM